MAEYSHGYIQKMFKRRDFATHMIYMISKGYLFV